MKDKNDLYNSQSNRNDVVQTLFDSIGILIKNLYLRWEDEKEYEDFAEYEKVMKTAAEKIEGIVFMKTTKRPFGFRFMYKARQYELTVKVKGDYLNLDCTCLQK